MPLLFNSPQQPTAFYRNALSGTDLNSADLVESIDTIGMEHADMTFQNWCFDGFRLAYAVLGQQQATSYGIKNDIDAVKIYFNRKGRTRINYQQLSKSFAIERGQYNMLYAAELDSSMSHLNVWEKNTRAIAFYRQHHFEITGTSVMMRGNDPQLALWMKKQL